MTAAGKAERLAPVLARHLRRPAQNHWLQICMALPCLQCQVPAQQAQPTTCAAKASSMGRACAELQAFGVSWF